MRPTIASSCTFDVLRLCFQEVLPSFDSYAPRTNALILFISSFFFNFFQSFFFTIAPVSRKKKREEEEPLSSEVESENLLEKINSFEFFIPDTVENIESVYSILKQLFLMIYANLSK